MQVYKSQEKKASERERERGQAHHHKNITQQTKNLAALLGE